MIKKIGTKSALTVHFEGHISDSSKILITKADKYFEFSLEIPVAKGIQFNNEFDSQNNSIIRFRNSKKTLYTYSKSLSVENISYTENFTKLLKGKILSFSSVDNYREKGKNLMRLMIPSKKDYVNNLFDDIENRRFVYQHNTRLSRSWSMVSCSLQDYSFDVYVVDENKSYFLVIDCLQKIDLELFNKFSYNILLGIGFITGNMILDNGYYFAFSDPEMTVVEYYIFQSLINSIITSMPVITTNPYSILRTDDIKNISRDEKNEISKTEETALDEDMNKISTGAFQIVA